MRRAPPENTAAPVCQLFPFIGSPSGRDKDEIRAAPEYDAATSQNTAIPMPIAIPPIETYATTSVTESTVLSGIPVYGTGGGGGTGGAGKSSLTRRPGAEKLYTPKAFNFEFGFDDKSSAAFRQYCLGSGTWKATPAMTLPALTLVTVRKCVSGYVCSRST